LASAPEITGQILFYGQGNWRDKRYDSEENHNSALDMELSPMVRSREGKMKNSHSMIARTLVLGLGLILVPGLFANPGGVQNCLSPSNNSPCKASVPEPSAIPELLLGLAVTGSGLLFLRRRNRAPV
jgi:hypothetical protein